MAKGKIELPIAQKLAGRLVDLLNPGCERIEIAGSIRRGIRSVGDIEIVCIPKVIDDPASESLFAAKKIPGTTPILERLKKEGVLEAIKDGGERLKSFWAVGLHTTKTAQLDLFLTVPQAWGYIFAIRTGPASYSKHIVTQRSRGGALRDGIKCADGRVWRAFESPSDPFEHNHPEYRVIDDWPYKLVRMTEESDFFDLVRGGLIPPEQRRYH